MKREEVVGVVSLKMVGGKEIAGCDAESLPVKFRLDSLGTLAARMIETMREKKVHGIAATQVGVLVKIFVMSFNNKPERIAVVFDPEYFQDGKSKRKRSGMETCPSFPLQAWNVHRYKKIKVRYQNVDGGVIEQKLKGEDAVLFQKLTDLCNGVTIKMVGEV